MANEALRRREVVARLVADRGDLLVVTGLGSTTYDCGAAGDHPLNFYLWGAMGSAVTVGLGLALAQPQRRVLVITGDGEMLMGLGALATVAVQAARQPRGRRDRQRAIRRDRHAGDPHGLGHRPRRHGGKGGLSRHRDSHDRATGRRRHRGAAHRRRARCSSCSRCRPRAIRSCCRRATAPTSSTASARRCWGRRRSPETQ